VAGTCVLLVAGTMLAAAFVLRERQDRIIQAVALEVANGVEIETAEEKLTTIEGAEEYFRETKLEGFRFELLGRDGALLASDGTLPGWAPEVHDFPIDAEATTPRLRADAVSQGRFRGCARFCGDGYVVRVVTRDVLDRAEIRRFGAALLFVFPIAAIVGTVLGRTLFRRRLAPLRQLEEAAMVSSAGPEASLRVETNARELTTLRDAFNGLLGRLGDALSRERRFSQEASHELRTPLAALRGRIESLASGGPLTEVQQEHAARALHEVDALDRLIDALLLLARSESSPMPATPVNLCDLARDAAERQAANDGASSPVPGVEAPDEVLVRGSEDLLARAIANLVENARKFAGPGAHIRIRVERNGTNAALAVADDGPGIPEGDRDRIFERFYRAPATRSTVNGVGLGLAVARAIVLRHRGTLQAARSDLGGAELRLEMPLLTPDIRL
jgi:signal transduction histidine kinase